MSEHIYAAIDLKSFYASVECVERGLDPLLTNLVVADSARTEKTICLAVSPSLKAYGIPGRARLFEVQQKVGALNAERLRRLSGRLFAGESCHAPDLAADPTLRIDYVVAPPRMASYMSWSARIYQIYLKYIAPEDLFAYSIDEVFMELTPYLPVSGCTPREFVARIIRDVLETTGITATAGIGTNLYLCKVAMDIGAKRVAPDEAGVRIAVLDERSYREQLWDHRPLTDFWRVGRGYASKLEQHGLCTMGDIARCSIGAPTDYYNEELLYKLFGVNAELLIDHAWGWEPCTIADVKSYTPEVSSLGTGQVLQCAYTAEKAKLIVREMTDAFVLDLVEKGLVTDQLTLTVSYDIDNLKDPARRKAYRGPVVRDPYGRTMPKHAHGTVHLGDPTSSTRVITDAMMDLYDRIVNFDLLVRRVNITASRVLPEAALVQEAAPEQLDLFTDYEARTRELAQQALDRAREKRLQSAMLSIKKRFGKNAILKAMNLEEGATMRERNEQIGGHKA